MNRRGAFTLIELCVSMSAGSALLILAIGMVHQSMALASAARGRADHQRTLNRLSDEFRRDVHRSTQCSVTAPENTQLTMSDETVITYMTTDNRVLRRQERDGKMIRRESFDFRPNTNAVMESLDGPVRAVLTVSTRLEHPIDAFRVDRRISAVVGRLNDLQNAEVSP